MSYPVIDLHCDLLGCIDSNPKKLTFTSPETNCSVPQLRAGNIAIQTLAISVLSEDETTSRSTSQVALYKELLKMHPESITSYRKPDSDKTRCIFSIENASALCSVYDPLEVAFTHLDRFSEIEDILYVSLTWNHENRFGGGNKSKVGLKADGKELLTYLAKQGIAIDLSHTSDNLAYDILSYIDQKNLDLVPIASHSNFRSVTNVARNLPDELVKEIVKRGGVIGLNFVRQFVGDTPSDFCKHIEYALTLGARDSLALGADFYGCYETPLDLMSDITLPTFQPGLNNSSCYPAFLSLVEDHFSKELAAKIAHTNAAEFLSTNSK